MLNPWDPGLTTYYRVASVTDHLPSLDIHSALNHPADSSWLSVSVFFIFPACPRDASSALTTTCFLFFSPNLKTARCSESSARMPSALLGCLCVPSVLALFEVGHPPACTHVGCRNRRMPGGWICRRTEALSRRNLMWRSTVLTQELCRVINKMK